MGEQLAIIRRPSYGCTDRGTVALCFETYKWLAHWPALIARRSYQIADAMLAERSKE